MGLHTLSRKCWFVTGGTNSLMGTKIGDLRDEVLEQGLAVELGR